MFESTKLLDLFIMCAQGYLQPIYTNIIYAYRHNIA